MPNLSNTQNPLDYPRYVRSLRPALAESLPTYVEDELEKIQNSVENLAFAADENAKAKVEVERILREGADETLASLITTVSSEFDSAIGDVNAAITNEITARTNADSALAADITNLSATVGDNTADISAEIIARADADTAIASSVTTLSTTVGGHTSTIASHTTSIGGLEAKYGVTLDVNGYVTGFEQNNSGTSGDFIVKADRFRVVSPGNPAISPFSVTGSGVQINGNLMVSGSITGSAIGTGQVDTGNIANNAATAPLSAFTSGFGTFNANVETLAQTLTVTTTGAPLEILGHYLFTCSGLGSGGAGVTVAIKRDGAIIFSESILLPTSSGGSQASITEAISDTPPAGTYTYTLHTTLDTVVSGATGSISSRYLRSLETKK